MSRSHPLGENNIQRIPASVINPRTGRPIRTDADTFRCLSEEQQMRAIEEEISNPRTTINPETNRAILLNGNTARELRAPGRLPRQGTPASFLLFDDARRNSSPRQNGAMHRHRNHERHEESPASTERVDSETANRMSIDNSEDGHHIVIRKHVAVTSPVTPEENDRSPTVGTNETGSRRDTVNGHDGSVLRGPRRLEYDDSSQAQSTNLVPSSRRANTSSERVNCGCCSLM
ncbi:uncharacterized protein Gasu_20530 [Galdieria sulphuraria]|uniref:Uncharacterized protein n=1 Tax=Galdieria sulphuraria TaxID=130081 RepID=M2W4A8_GALSU|nr:uncharacterized protein Gasu_20530 [Galdieria sulphuraria]EME30591.1 hypothetical protein Gasu_20530 [Galdieria sulphuraria]|eukprot:XP_005707111.1 hypothetical protein Gasu_20530 [Galdieria sulphuraria]